jgi:hypothetical protein
MTAPNLPAAAARRQYAIDRLVELLIGWGCPLDVAEYRADLTLAAVLDAGYRLPAALTDVPDPRTAIGSTPEGRAAARATWEAARRRKESPQP